MTNPPIAVFLILFCFLNAAHPTHAQTDSLRQALNSWQLPATLQTKDTAYFVLADAVCSRYFGEMALDSLKSVADRSLLLLNRFPARPKDVDNRLNYFKMRFCRFKGIALIQQGDYPNALSAFQQYAEQAEKLSSVKDLGNSYTYIGYCHRAMEDYTLAYQYAQKSMALLKNTPYRAAMANNYTTFSACFAGQLNNLDSAIYYAKLARQIYHEEHNPVNEAIAAFDIAADFSLKFQPDSALVYIEQAKDFALEDPASDMAAHYHIRLGEALFIKGAKKEALYHLQLGSKLAADLDNPKFAYHANKFRSLALALNGQTVAAIQCMDETTGGFAELINVQKIREMNKVQLNAEFEKKQALAELELQKQKNIRDISLIGLILGLIVALLLFRLYRQSQKNARILTEKNNQIEQSYQALKTTQAQLVLTEKQREAQSVRVRIARDIHDELGAGLTKITIMSDVVRKKLGPGHEELAQMLQRIAENSKGVSASLSEIVWAVNPAHDSLESLSTYLKNYAAHFLDGTNVQPEFDFPLQLPEKTVSPEWKRQIFLVLKEALNNAVKYARADKILVAFHTDGEQFTLQIRDNGQGFDPESPAAQNGSGGNGLPNMKSRMEQLHCQLHVVSAPGQGCTVEASGKII